MTYAAVTLHGGLAAALETTRARLAQVPAALTVLTTHPPLARNYEGYLRDCTRPGDRLLVTGNTPFYIPYYTERPMAGGHLYWHSMYRHEDDQQQAALRLLAAQSVPFAVSSSDPVMGDFTRAYPLVARYLATRYEEVPGTHGRILVERQRARTGTFGPDGWPCFR